VSGGALHLRLTRQPNSCGGKARPYTSGMINTDGKFRFTYGFMEARIYLPGLPADMRVAYVRVWQHPGR
jgi:beta-glucanase (GH16 family)